MLYNKLNIADNGYFTIQTIIDIVGVHGAISDVVCVGSPVIIINSKKKLTNKYTQKIWNFQLE